MLLIYMHFGIRSARFAIFRAVLAVGGITLLANGAYSAEKSLEGEAALNYKFDDNINVSNVNKIALAGFIVDGAVEGAYDTGRFRTSGRLELSFERYNHSTVDSNDPTLQDPDPEAFNSDNQFLNGDLAYSWQRHRTVFGARYDRDSTLNTQFTDTGLGAREVEGTSRRTLAGANFSWNWTLTERQNFLTSIIAQSVSFDTDRLVDYNFANATVTWGYALTERFNLQLVPIVSWFRNEADLAVRSNTYGMQGGFDWDVSELWNFNLLLGATQVHTVYGKGGIIFVDPVTGQTVELKDQDSNSFIGRSAVAYEGEYIGFSFVVASNVSPSANGVLRQNHNGRLIFDWQPLERLRVKLDGQLGSNQSTDDRIEDGRLYGQTGLRLSYRFSRQWWMSGSYRFREQNYENSELGTAHGNSVFFTLSYNLPKEIL